VPIDATNRKHPYRRDPATTGRMNHRLAINEREAVGSNTASTAAQCPMTPIPIGQVLPLE